ncbi:MAG: site-specific DNA-methyltransferase [Cellvibrionales bacterium]|nr:site-specific DNA-methyltransferase [Cellvibrionales bacterium]
MLHAKPIITDAPLATVFSKDRCITAPALNAPAGLHYNTRLKMDGLDLLSKLPANAIPVAFFDPQYRGVLDKLSYGNEGVSRGKARCSLAQMSEKTIQAFIAAISRSLIPSGHLFLWMDKFHLCTGFANWLEETALDVVDMLTWHKGRIGMGYRTRRTSEHLVVLQKKPRRAKGIWKVHTIPDIWSEQVKPGSHAHKKPTQLQGELIAAVSNPGDLVIDPAAGSFSVLEACQNTGRNFLGCDLNG